MGKTLRTSARPKRSVDLTSFLVIVFLIRAVARGKRSTLRYCTCDPVFSLTQGDVAAFLVIDQLI